MYTYNMNENEGYKMTTYTYTITAKCEDCGETYIGKDWSFHCVECAGDVVEIEPYISTYTI